MIIGKIEELDNYKGLSERIGRATEFLLNLNPEIPVGKHIIDGDDIYANVICGETSSMEEVKFEAHRKYLDLQYVIDGEEIMVYAPINNCFQETDYNEESDYCLLNGKGSEIKVKAGEFYLLYPFDAHAPAKGYQKTKFKKIIVKIKL